MSNRFSFIVLFSIIIFNVDGRSQSRVLQNPSQGYDRRIKDYVQNLRIVDSHEHLFLPEQLKNTYFLDFTLMLHQNGYDDLVSAGMPDSIYNLIFNSPRTPVEKWKLIEPYWNNSFNTTYHRVMIEAAGDLYGVNGINDSTVGILSAKMKLAYSGDWFNHVLKDLCKFDYVIQESDYLGPNRDFVRYTEKFSDYLTVRTKFRIDSLAAVQVEPIYTLENFVKSMKLAFDEALKRGVVAVKVNVAYARTLNFENVSADAARKVFRNLINGNENFEISFKDAKPLQDYMLHQLLDMARKQGLPVAFHTGLQAGNGNVLNNSDPALLTNLFLEYPDINFVLYHSSYPYGGTLSAIVKNFKNVNIDMNWTYSISQSYAERYLNEWLEAVPASKIMAFGGDQRSVENTYAELQIARKIISNVLIKKVSEGDLTEEEAKTTAKMILHDNQVRFYNLK
jgi:uncharacterized protein